MSVGSLSLSADSLDPETEDENLFGISVVSDVLETSLAFVSESCSSEDERPCSQPEVEEERPCSQEEEEEVEERPCSQEEEEDVEERPCSQDEESD